MIKTNNDKILRNLQEQVLYNSNVLEDFVKGDKTIAEFGIHVIGIYEQLPEDLDEEQLSVGDAILVGTEAPYAYYVWTNDKGEYEWVNIGTFPQPGPQGEQGPKGDKGDKGDASKWYYGDLPSPTGYTLGDMWLTKSGDVYTLTSNGWISTLNIKGPRGLQGERGAKGEQGIQGPKGETGPRGPEGKVYQIKAVLASEIELEAQTVTPNTAYLVGTEAPYDIYVSVIGDRNYYQRVGNTELNVAALDTLVEEMADVQNKLKDVEVQSSGDIVIKDKDLVVDKIRAKTKLPLTNGENISGALTLSGLHKVGTTLLPSTHLFTWDNTNSVVKAQLRLNAGWGALLQTDDNQLWIQQGDTTNTIRLQSGNIDMHSNQINLWGNTYVRGSAVVTETDLDAVGTKIDNLGNSVGQLRTDLTNRVDNLSNSVEGVENKLSGKTVIDSYNIDEENQTINIVLGSL